MSQLRHIWRCKLLCFQSLHLEVLSHSRCQQVSNSKRRSLSARSVWSWVLNSKHWQLSSFLFQVWLWCFLPCENIQNRQTLQEHLKSLFRQFLCQQVHSKSGLLSCQVCKCHSILQSWIWQYSWSFVVSHWQWQLCQLEVWMNMSFLWQQHLLQRLRQWLSCCHKCSLSLLERSGLQHCWTWMFRRQSLLQRLFLASWMSHHRCFLCNKVSKQVKSRSRQFHLSMCLHLKGQVWSHNIRLLEFQQVCLWCCRLLWNAFQLSNLLQQEQYPKQSRRLSLQDNIQFDTLHSLPPKLRKQWLLCQLLLSSWTHRTGCSICKFRQQLVCLPNILSSLNIRPSLQQELKCLCFHQLLTKPQSHSLQVWLCLWWELPRRKSLASFQQACRPWCQMQQYSHLLTKQHKVWLFHCLWSSSFDWLFRLVRRLFRRQISSQSVCSQLCWSQFRLTEWQVGQRLQLLVRLCLCRLCGHSLWCKCLPQQWLWLWHLQQLCKHNLQVCRLLKSHCRLQPKKRSDSLRLELLTRSKCCQMRLCKFRLHLQWCLFRQLKQKRSLYQQVFRLSMWKFLPSSLQKLCLASSSGKFDLGQRFLRPLSSQQMCSHLSKLCQLWSLQMSHNLCRLQLCKALWSRLHRQHRVSKFRQSKSMDCLLPLSLWLKQLSSRLKRWHHWSWCSLHNGLPAKLQRLSHLPRQMCKNICHFQVVSILRLSCHNPNPWRCKHHCLWLEQKVRLLSQSLFRFQQCQFVLHKRRRLGQLTMCICWLLSEQSKQGCQVASQSFENEASCQMLDQLCLELPSLPSWSRLFLERRLSQLHHNRMWLAVKCKVPFQSFRLELWTQFLRHLQKQFQFLRLYKQSMCIDFLWSRCWFRLNRLEQLQLNSHFQLLRLLDLLCSGHIRSRRKSMAFRLSWCHFLWIQVQGQNLLFRLFCQLCRKVHIRQTSSFDRC